MCVWRGGGGANQFQLDLVFFKKKLTKPISFLVGFLKLFMAKFGLFLLNKRPRQRKDITSS